MTQMGGPGQDEGEEGEEMGYSIEELREMLTEWAGWGETMADGRIGSDAAARFLADFERLVREDALSNVD